MVLRRTHYWNWNNSKRKLAFKYLTRETFSLGFENPFTTCLRKLHGNAFLAGNSIYIHTASLRGNLEKSSSQKQRTRKVIILLVGRRGSERMDAVGFLLPCQTRVSSANKGDPSISWLYQRTWDTSLFLFLIFFFISCHSSTWWILTAVC